jgi:hypothetical protein
MNVYYFNYILKARPFNQKVLDLKSAGYGPDLPTCTFLASILSLELNVSSAGH